MNAPATPDLTRALAEETASLDFAALSAEDVEQVKCLILDHVGVGLRGATLSWGTALTQWAETLGADGRCVLYGSALRTAPTAAALVNATAAHGMELDDTHDASVCHPGAVVIATAIAVGTARGASGHELIAAIVAGYEVMARAGMATGAADIIEHGFHPTALFGGFGAATAAGKLYGLDADRLQQAWGLMLSMAGGSMQFSQDAHGTTVKRLHGGYGAHNGTLAAELAALGIAGPAQALDGQYGLCALFGSNPDTARLARPAGAPFEIHRISLKPYPCCRLFHSTIDALRDATDAFSTDLDDIAAVRVGGPDIMVTQHMMRRPSSVMAAQYSLPFALGATLAYGPERYEAYAEDKLGDERILALGDKVEAVEDGAMQAAFPEHFGSWVEITKRDGTVRREDVLDSYGTPARPMPAAAIKEKIAGLLDPIGRAADVEPIATQIWALDQAGDTAALAALLGEA